MNYLDLIRNAILLGLRNLSRNRLTSLITISGLAIAVGCVVTVFIFIDMQYNLDSFHLKKDRIYQVVSQVSEGDQDQLWGDSPILLAPQIILNYSTVERAARIKRASGNVRYKDDVFQERLTFVDPSYFQIFDFPVLYGDRQVLEQKEYVGISRNISIKYFGQENPLGKELSIKFSNGKINLYTIGMVVEYPNNTSFEPDFYLNIESFFDLGLRGHYQWSDLVDATFLLLGDASYKDDLQQVLEQYRSMHNQSNPTRRISNFEMISLSDLGSRSYEIQGSITNSSMPSERIVLVVIALLLLLMACFNYVNIAVSSATRRLREIALRKVFGGIRKHIIVQFLAENLVISLFAVATGVLLSYFLFLPWFDSIAPDHIPFAFSSVPLMILFFALLILVVTFGSGMYPALYISRFLPVAIFRGEQAFGKRRFLGQVLLGLQFIIAFVTVVGSFIFTDNAIFLNGKDWGYNPKGIMSIPVENSMQYDQLRNLIREHPDVERVAGSYGHIGYDNNLENLDHLGKQFRVFVFLSRDQYLETMNLRLHSGRFLEDSKIDQLNAAVVNRQFVKKMGWDDPINQSFSFQGQRKTIVGVVEDFHTQNFYQEMLPVLFLGGEKKELNYLTLSCDEPALSSIDEFALQCWQSVSPDDPFERVFQSDAFDGFFIDNEANITVMIFISILAIVLASLGLYGLMSFEVCLRVKEFCIRKVMGARSHQIIWLANSRYFRVLLIAFVFGAPLGYHLINRLIVDLYPDPKEAGFYPFIASIVVLIFIAFATVSSQTKAAVDSNPVENLRGE